MNATLHPAAEHPVDLEKYLLHSRYEIIALLRDVIASRTLVTITFNRGRDTIITSLLQVNPDFEELIFDCGSHVEANRNLLNSQSVVVTAFIDRVKIEFSAPRVEATDFQQTPALRIRVPQSILRFQRREYYRLSPPVSDSLECAVSGMLDNRNLSSTVRVIDISCGGVCLLIDPAMYSIVVGQTFDRCHIELPEGGTVVTAITIRSISEDDRADLKGRRCGCQFINIPGTMQNMIQRYITKIERDRRARA